MSTADFSRSKKKAVYIQADGDAIPTAITDPLEIVSGSQASLEYTSNDQNDVAGATLSNRANIHGLSATSLEIQGNLKSFGDAANSKPAIAPYLLACGFKEVESVAVMVVDGTQVTIGGDIVQVVGNLVVTTNTAAISDGDAVGGSTADGDGWTCYSYQPDSTNTTGKTVLMWCDGLLYGAKGAQGNFTFSCGNSGELAKFSLSFQGGEIDENDTEVAMPTITQNVAAKSPVWRNSELTYNIDGTIYKTPVTQAEFNAGNTVELLMDANDSTGYAGSSIQDRNDAASTVTQYIRLSDNFSASTLKKNDTIFNVSYMVGQGGRGRTIVVTQRSAINEISYEDDAQRKETLTLGAVGANGDDEYVLTFA